MNNNEIYGDAVWENLLQSSWGKYPPEEVVRFYFNMVKKAFKFPKVLDIGSGQGACTWFMGKEGAQVTAFEGSNSGLAKVPIIAKEFGVSKNIDLLIGDITKPKVFVKKKYDVFLDNYSLYSNAEEKVCTALSEYFEILYNGGLFLMNCFGEKTSGYGTGTQLSENTFRDVEGILKNRGIVTWFTRERINNIFNNIGFKIVYTEDVTHENNGVFTEKLISCIKKPN